jgi:hypothetical protein
MADRPVLTLVRNSLKSTNLSNLATAHASKGTSVRAEAYSLIILFRMFFPLYWQSRFHHSCSEQ